VLTKVV